MELVEESTAEIADTGRYINYIPHMAVVKLDKVSTRGKPVFDASAKNRDGISLNSNLLPGPKTQLSISHLMIHLRMIPVVLIGDSSRMFYAINYKQEADLQQIKVSNLRDLYRFLWNKDPDQIPSAHRFLSMLMGARDSPYASSATIRHHLAEIIATSKDEEEVKIAILVKARLYIDDLILALSCIEEAIKMRLVVTYIFKNAGMMMTKWATNSQEVLATIPLTDRAPIEDIQFYLEQTEQSPASKPTKVIGMTWKPAEDSFTFESYKHLVHRTENIRYSERGIFRLVPKIYDINGQIWPFVLRGKLILQKWWTFKKRKEIRP